MREVKFRAWDLDDKKMRKVVAIKESIWGDCEEAHILMCDFDKSPEDKATDVRLSVNYDLMQYTGLKDVNGREIYEGDLVITPLSSPYLVEYDEERAAYVLEWVENEDRYEEFLGMELEVIGNIYENPELLEETNE